MSDAAIFVLVFGGLVVLRVVVATVLFFFILPAGDRCINCDAPTLRVQPARWHKLFPWLRPSWCYECGWKGMLRSGELTPEVPPPPARPTPPEKERPKPGSRSAPGGGHHE
jgi:hypothetical protein